VNGGDYAVDTSPAALNELDQRAQAIYDQIRSQIENRANIGKIIVIDVDSGDYEIDDRGIEASRRLRNRHPHGNLYALRIGYTAVEVLGGVLQRTSQCSEAASAPSICSFR